MLSRFKILEGFKGFGTQRGWKICELISSKCFCTTNESPELPDWVKCSSDRVGESVDDFVIPSSSMKYVEDNQKVKDCVVGVGTMGVESVEKDVDEISRILTCSYISPEEVVKALSGCEVVVREGLVDKVIRRFSNDWMSAYGFFRWYQMQKGYEESADLYDLMVDVLGKTKMFDIMWDLVVEMVQLGGMVSLTTMTRIMRRLARGGKHADAIATFRGIERFGLTRDVAAMNVLLDALCKERGVEYAWEAFLEFKNEIPPNAHTFNVMIHGCCKFRKLDKARSTLEEMESCGFRPCVVSYTSLVEAYCREKDFRMVDALLDEMQAKGCPPNVVTYTIVMHSLGKAKETYDALGIYERMKKNGCVPDISFYNSLIYILSKAGRLQDANNVYEEIPKNGCMPDVTTYNTMISAACEHSQVENALKLLKEMEERLCKPELKTFAPLLKICCQKKWLKILFFLLDDMLKKDISIDLSTYCLLVNGLCKSGSLEQACLLFEKIVLKELIPWSSTYSRLMDELKRKNMENEREKIQQLMLQAQSVKQPS
ncbi:hypothetical protein ACHQM5_027468 [Ranunculus cassubicifolius]